MSYKRVFFLLFLRVLVLLAWIIGIAYSYYFTKLFITPVMFGLLALVSIAELTWHLHKQERNWIKFLESIKYHDFNRVYQKHASKELSDAYELITRGMEELQANNQVEYQLLQTVLRHISVAVICYKGNGSVVFTNKSFEELLNLPGLSHIDRLKDKFPTIYDALLNAETNTDGWINHINGQKLFVKTEPLKLKGISHQLVSLTDIRSSLEAKELESYQRLMRVITHEIMNSTNPIFSLIKVVNNKLVEGQKLSKLNEKDQRNVAISLHAIEERTAGMLKFITSYKSINRTIKPNFKLVQSDAFVNSVEALMGNLNNGQLAIHDELKAELYIDQALMQQVMINLIQNADEALENHDNGKVNVILTQDRDYIYLSVIDNGMGVNEKDLQQLFVPFFTTKNDGSGIGLALSRKIIRLHGGTLEHLRESDQTNFRIKFPVSHVAPQL